MPPKAIHKRVHEWKNEMQQGFIYHNKKKIRIFRDKEKNPMTIMPGIPLHVRFQDSDISCAPIDGRDIYMILNAVLYVPRPIKSKKPTQQKTGK